MDTTKPPLICPTCNEAIEPGAPTMELRYPTDEEGEQTGPVIAYHEGCAPPTD